MKNEIIYLLIAIFLSLNGNSQNLVDISISEVVQKRMETALTKFNSFPIPKWCNTDELKMQRSIVIEKCIKTLYHNYVAPKEGIFYEGIVPSPTTFNELWAWDSWKHAYALAYLDKDLAENSIRAMYDYQDSLGMIADCIFVNKKENNYRDTKPPLSVWAVYQIYLQTKDVNFVKEMYPKLLKYHYWWYKYRDHDKNGLCEYGSVGNTIEAAKWESGWDNAIRFDEAKMLKNSENAFSMNIESVDLNSYLYIEKDLLIKIAFLLKDNGVAKKLKSEKEKLGQQIQNTFYDKNTGFFYDVRIEDKSFIMSKEASGWIPLFAGVATKEQAEKVKNMIMNEDAFNTLIPMPTVSKDNPKYNPSKGYWRGPVWIDQFYFGYIGLKKYGFNKEAEYLLLKLLKNGQGIKDPNIDLRENYNPITGEGLCAKMFGWTAAHIFMMMIE